MKLISTLQRTVFWGKGGLRWVLVAARGIFIASLGIFHYGKRIYTDSLVVALGISVSVLGLSYSTACEFFLHWGVEPTSLALQGRFLTTGPTTRKVLGLFFFFEIYFEVCNDKMT